MLAGAIALATLAGCAHLGATSPRASAPPGTVLRIGTSGDYAPFSITDTSGTLAGFDVEVARAYAADRGRELVFVPFHWPELATRLAAGDFDVVMSGVTVRPDRLVTGIMTAPVARAEAVLAVAASTERAAVDAGSDASMTRTTSFDRPERTIAVNRGGHLEQIARAHFPHAHLIPVDDNAGLPALLARGEADAIVTDTLELAAFAARDAPAHDDGGNGATPRIAARLAHDRKAYWLPLSRAALAADLDMWLLEHERSGWLPALRTRLFASAGAAALAAPVASLVEHVRQRLSLMTAVAAAKRAANVPVEDLVREAVVTRDAAARATAVGLDAASFVAFVHDEISAAKAIQRAAPADTHATFTLDQLRRAIDRADARIVVELAALAPLAASPETVTAEIGDDVPGITPALARALARTLAGVRPRPDTSTGRTPYGGGILDTGGAG